MNKKDKEQITENADETVAEERSDAGVPPDEEKAAENEALVNETDTPVCDEADGAASDSGNTAQKEKNNAKDDTKTSKEDKKHAAEHKKIKEENEKLSKQIEEANERYMRVLAEYDNYRKRTQREKENIYSDAYADVLKEIFPVMDNLERALSYANQNSAEDDKLESGIRLTLKTFTDALGKLGVEAVGKPGDSFDPNLHNAVAHVEDEEAGENVIVEVFQKGYRKGDRVMRFAMVKVAN